MGSSDEYNTRTIQRNVRSGNFQKFCGTEVRSHPTKDCSCCLFRTPPTSICNSEIETMRRPDFIARQSACPSGIFGRLLARIMSFETDIENEMTLRFLELKPEDHVLEIGFGHGKTIKKAAGLVPHGFVAGVDVSPLMVRIAGERNRHFLRQGRVQIKLGDGSHIPYSDSVFDKCFSVHSLYFWPEPVEALKEIHRVLKSEGLFLLCFRYDERALRSFPRSVYSFYKPEEVITLLEVSGFQCTAIESRVESSRTLFWAIGKK